MYIYDLVYKQHKLGCHYLTKDRHGRGKNDPYTLSTERSVLSQLVLPSASVRGRSSSLLCPERLNVICAVHHLLFNVLHLQFSHYFIFSIQSIFFLNSRNCKTSLQNILYTIQSITLHNHNLQRLIFKRMHICRLLETCIKQLRWKYICFVVFNLLIYLCLTNCYHSQSYHGTTKEQISNVSY